MIHSFCVFRCVRPTLKRFVCVGIVFVNVFVYHVRINWTVCMRHCARNRRCAQNVECAQPSVSSVQCTFGSRRFVSPKCSESLIYDMSFNCLALCIMPFWLPTLWRKTK